MIVTSPVTSTITSAVTLAAFAVTSAFTSAVTSALSSALSFCGSTPLLSLSCLTGTIRVGFEHGPYSLLADWFDLLVCWLAGLPDGCHADHHPEYALSPSRPR